MGLVTFRSLTPRSDGSERLGSRLHWSLRTVYEGRPIIIVNAPRRASLGRLVVSAAGKGITQSTGSGTFAAGRTGS